MLEFEHSATPGPVVLLPASTNHPVYLFDCSNKKNDRCTNPAPKSYTAGQVLAGPLTEAGSLSQTGAGDLIAHNDPFDATFLNGPGESYPHDTSLEILVDGVGADSLVPAGVRLANVCSYPSAGNGGNNNPFDCVVTPGIQYGTLRVTKVVTNDNGGTATFGNFSYSVDGGTPLPRSRRMMEPSTSRSPSGTTASQRRRSQPAIPPATPIASMRTRTAPASP